MSDMTMPEVEREFGRLERRFADTVSKQVYERDMTETRSDIAEIKDSQKWAMRLIVAQFISFVFGLIVFLIANFGGL